MIAQEIIARTLAENQIDTIALANGALPNLQMANLEESSEYFKQFLETISGSCGQSPGWRRIRPRICRSGNTFGCQNHLHHRAFWPSQNQLLNMPERMWVLACLQACKADDIAERVMEAWQRFDEQIRR